MAADRRTTPGVGGGSGGRLKRTRFSSKTRSAGLGGRHDRPLLPGLAGLLPGSDVTSEGGIRRVAVLGPSALGGWAVRGASESPPGKGLGVKRHAIPRRRRS